MKKERFISLILSRACNRKCWYCDIFTNEKRFDVDLDYIKWICSFFHYVDLTFEISGGEPGLCDNLIELVETLEKIPWVKKIDIMSNGLVRKQYDIIDLKKNFKKINTYDEHLIYDVKNDKIIKNNDLDFDFINTRQICVLTESILDFFIENDFNKNFFYFKPMNFKSINLLNNNNYINKLNNFLNIIEGNIFLDDLKFKINKFEQKNLLNCIKNKTNTFILLEEKKIGSCCVSISKSDIFDLNKEYLLNFEKKEIKKMNMCDTCISWW